MQGLKPIVVSFCRSRVSSAFFSKRFWRAEPDSLPMSLSPVFCAWKSSHAFSLPSSGAPSDKCVLKRLSRIDKLEEIFWMLDCPHYDDRSRASREIPIIF